MFEQNQRLMTAVCRQGAQDHPGRIRLRPIDKAKRSVKRSQIRPDKAPQGPVELVQYELHQSAGMATAALGRSHQQCPHQEVAIAGTEANGGDELLLADHGHPLVTPNFLLLIPLVVKPAGQWRHDGRQPLSHDRRQLHSVQGRCRSKVVISVTTDRRKRERRQTEDRRSQLRYGEEGHDRRHRLGRRQADQKIPIL